MSCKFEMGRTLQRVLCNLLPASLHCLSNLKTMFKTCLFMFEVVFCQFEDHEIHCRYLMAFITLLLATELNNVKSVLC